jgi:hypothetical protein
VSANVVTPTIVVPTVVHAVPFGERWTVYVVELTDAAQERFTPVDVTDPTAKPVGVAGAVVAFVVAIYADPPVAFTARTRK